MPAARDEEDEAEALKNTWLVISSAGRGHRRRRGQVAIPVASGDERGVGPCPSDRCSSSLILFTKNTWLDTRY